MADETAKLLTCEETGRMGGLTRARKLSPEQRREIARRAAQARWGKRAPGAPDPSGPGGPHRDHQHAEAGIMLSARRSPKSCRKPASPSRKAIASLSLFEVEGLRAA